MNNPEHEQHPHVENTDGSQFKDPVCGMTVAPPGKGHVLHNDHDYFFVVKSAYINLKQTLRNTTVQRRKRYSQLLKVRFIPVRCIQRFDRMALEFAQNAAWHLSLSCHR